MARRRRSDLLEHRRDLALLIRTALKNGRCADPDDKRHGQPWTDEAFGLAVGQATRTVTGWRSREKPCRPENIQPLLRVFYGDNERFAQERDAMLVVWRRAGDIPDLDPPPPPQTIEAHDFIDVARIVDLAVFQPTPDNAGNNQVLPFRLIISPDRQCEIVDKQIEIGVTEAFVMIQSDHWQPNRESVFSNKTHPNVHKDATPNGLHLIGPRDNSGCIDGEPLEDVPMVKMEPKAEEPDSAIEVSVRVYRDGFKVTPKDGEVSGTQKVVLDAIFASAIEKDSGKRLIVAKRTVKPRVSKGTV